MPISTELQFPVVKSLHKNEVSWTHGIERDRTAKQVVEAGSVAASLGIQGAGIGVGITSGGTVGGAILTGAAVSATGVGLAVAGGAIAVGGMVASGISVKKTYNHIYNLNSLHNRKNAVDFTCTCAAHGHDTKRTPNHEYISGEILDYIIHQKKHKMGKKSAGAVGGGLLTGIYAAGRKAYKRSAVLQTLGLRETGNTLGVKRTFAANLLATHLITHNCVLTERIVTELLSLVETELDWLKKQNSEVVGGLLARKMKSK